MLKPLSITLITALTASTALAETFNITSGSATNAGNTVNGSDTVNISGALNTGSTANEPAIETTGGTNTINLLTAGSFTTAGTFSNGIYNNGDNNTNSISGTINTTGANGYGIINTGDNNTNTITGSIATSGATGLGLYNIGDNNTNSITGTINTSGTNAKGVYNDGDDNTNTITGTITTIGAGANGVDNYGGGNSTTVTGTITTSGEDADGVWSGHGTGISNTVSVTGNITTTGDKSSGIEFYGATNSATISGTINSSGTDSSALRNQNGNGNSFQLNEGAIIIGDILAIGGSTVTNGKLIFNLGEGTSYAYSVSGNGSGTSAGQWTFSDLDGRTQGVSTTGSGCNLSIANANTSTCNLVTAVTPGNIEAQNELQYASNRSFINSLNFGLAKDRSSGKGVWLEAYGDKADRDASTTNATAFALDTNSSGLTLGKPLKFGENLNLDLIFNGSSTDLDIGTTKDQKIASKSYNLGLVLHNLSSSDNWNVNAFGFVGNNSYDGKRKVMNNQVSTGSETVTASYSGTELLLGFNAGYNNAITDNLSFIANLNANLSYETIGAYSESKYYSWDKRDLTQTAGGLKVGLNYTKNSFSTFATVGTDFNSLQNGNKATYKNNGTTASYTDTEDGDTFGTASFGISYKAENGPTFTAGIDGFSSNKGLSGNSANVSLDWAF
ncbi:autotransporter domain-containing protein [Amylibacter sp.]|nr:autotransporter domain-containing protein [Amylibacter sp.]